MKILAIDASGHDSVVAVCENDEPVFECRVASPRGRGAAIFTVIADALRQCGNPDRIAVGLGPGAYNGLRVSVATAEGLSLACGADRVGILSLRALATDATTYACVGDTRGSMYYFAKFEASELVGDIDLVSKDDLGKRIHNLGQTPVFATAAIDGIPDLLPTVIDPVRLARLASSATAAARPLIPIYLKPPHITAARTKN